MKVRVELSSIWLHGTVKYQQNYSHEECLDIMRRTCPTGELAIEPIMTDEEAEETLRTGNFPDNWWERWCAGEIKPQFNYEQAAEGGERSRDECKVKSQNAK